MARVRLNGHAVDERIDLQTTKVELELAQRQVNKVIHNGRGTKLSDPLVVVDRDLFTHIVNDFNLMVKLLKQRGVKSKHALHYNESKAFQKSMDKITEKDVPAFLRKRSVETAGQQKRVKLKP